MIEKFKQAYARRVRLGEDLSERMRAAKLASTKLQVIDRLHFLKWILQSENLEPCEVQSVGIFSCSNYACVGIPVAFANGAGWCATCAEQRSIPMFAPKRRWSSKQKRTHGDLVEQYGSSEPETIQQPIQLPFWQNQKDWDTEDGNAPF